MWLKEILAEDIESSQPIALSTWLSLYKKEVQADLLEMAI